MEVVARLLELVELAQHRRDAKLAEPLTLALGHRAIALDRELVAPRFFGDLREIELDDTVLAVAGLLQVLEQRLRPRPILHLDREHRDAELVLARVLVL